jgi:aspartate/methionine/tyrosine aminotransferase
MPSIVPLARPLVESIEASKIREVANAGARLDGVIPLWFGEPDRVTPDFIRDAARQGLDDGLTFYGPNTGMPELRETIAGYECGLGRRLTAAEVCVTASGVNALMLGCQALVDPGDRVVVLTPAWPNIAGIPKVLGARVEFVALHCETGRWTLDLQRLLDRLTPDTRMLIVNAPANPTGWVMPRADQQVLIEQCRRHGIWIAADDVYERLYYPDDGPVERPVAPSFLDLAGPDDQVIGINSFSKAWAMTGWRLGWLSAPQSLMPSLAKLAEFNISCTPAFVQRAGIAAIAAGEPFVRDTVARYRRLRDVAADVLRQSPRLAVTVPSGGMYHFVSVDGCDDSLRLALDLLHATRVGIAPGSAFGSAGEGCLRICIATDEAKLVDACGRIVEFLGR